MRESNGRVPKLIGDAAFSPAWVGVSRADQIIDSILQTILPDNSRARLRAVAWIGYVAHKLRNQGRLESRLQRFNDQWDSEDLRRISTEVQIRYRLLQHLRSNIIKGRFKSIAKAVEIVGADEVLGRSREKQPTILVMCHLGFPEVIFAGLHQLGISMTTLVSTPFIDRFLHAPDTIRAIPTEDHPVSGGRALKMSLDCLGDGGFMVIGFDGPRGDSKVESEFFGHKIALRRGAAVLARLSNAAIYPVVGRWRPNSGTLELRVFERVNWGAKSTGSIAGFEREFCQSACEWFEAYIRREPYDLTNDILNLCEIR